MARTDEVNSSYISTQVSPDIQTCIIPLPFTLLEGGITNIETGEVTSISLSPIAEGVPELRSLDTSSAGSSLERRLGQLALTCYNEGTPSIV
uniref:Uncharacterized protein n=1 Tax=Psilocybe cubensis TaxID=181762 RepID=A0A8H7XLW0_PSICU